MKRPENTEADPDDPEPADGDIQMEYSFTFMLPCIVIDFLLNNQPYAPIIQIYSVIKLYMFRASSLPIIRSFLLYVRHWFHAGF
jgi:hypothetical protein